MLFKSSNAQNLIKIFVAHFAIDSFAEFLPTFIFWAFSFTQPPLLPIDVLIRNQKTKGETEEREKLARKKFPDGFTILWTLKGVFSSSSFSFISSPSSSTSYPSTFSPKIRDKINNCGKVAWNERWWRFFLKFLFSVLSWKIIIFLQLEYNFYGAKKCWRRISQDGMYMIVYLLVSTSNVFDTYLPVCTAMTYKLFKTAHNAPA